MSRPFHLGLPLLALTLACGSSSSESGSIFTLLQNDDYPTSAAAFQTGFAAGEAIGAVLGPVQDASSLTEVRLLFGGGGTSQTVTLTIYADTGGTVPGALLYSGDYELTSTNDALQVVDLSGAGIAIPAGSRIRVALFFQHTGVPGPARDADLSAAHNYVYTAAAWATNASLSIAGDWVIRARFKTD